MGNENIMRVIIASLTNGMLLSYSDQNLRLAVQYSFLREGIYVHQIRISISDETRMPPTPISSKPSLKSLRNNSALEIQPKCFRIFRRADESR
mmetsp:Transcript_34900/g.74450  ORF Transcript_34900/g.74450 Transcript_34900/m.74450 type:complete len:93 (+) Transcript_34900:952-1230(+)